MKVRQKLVGKNRKMDRTKRGPRQLRKARAPFGAKQMFVRRIALCVSIVVLGTVASIVIAIDLQNDSNIQEILQPTQTPKYQQIQTQTPHAAIVDARPPAPVAQVPTQPIPEQNSQLVPQSPVPANQEAVNPIRHYTPHQELLSQQTQQHQEPPPPPQQLQQAQSPVSTIPQPQQPPTQNQQILQQQQQPSQHLQQQPQNQPQLQLQSLLQQQQQQPQPQPQPQQPQLQPQLPQQPPIQAQSQPHPHHPSPPAQPQQSSQPSQPSHQPPQLQIQYQHQHHHQHYDSPLYTGHIPFIERLRPNSYADDNIVTLNLSHSYIYEIDSDAFVGQRFEHIDLSNNKLGLIHSRSFRIGPKHSRHQPFKDPRLANETSHQANQTPYPTRRPPPPHPKKVIIDFSHNPAIVALSGAFDHIDAPNCLLNFTNSTVELKFGAFKKYFKEHPGHIIDIETVDCCDQEWLLGYKHNFVPRTHCAHDPNLYLLKVSQQTIIDSCIAYVTSARHSMTMPSSNIIQSAAANLPRGHQNSHVDNQYLTYMILGGTAMILTSLSIYIIFYMFSLKAAFVYQTQMQTTQPQTKN